MRPRAVIQEEPSGCGFACVAMLTGKSYAEIKAFANGHGIFADDLRLWSETHYVRELLARHGVWIAPGEEPFAGWDRLPDLALLAIKHRVEEGRPLWHWTVFRRAGGKGVVLDPAPYLDANERDDFDTMQPAWFIAVGEASP